MRSILLSAVVMLPFAGFCQQQAATIIDSAAQPRVFAPGIVSTRYDEWATSFTPDGQTVYFSRGGVYWTVCFSKNIDGVWQRPQVAGFSGVWRDTDPFVSPDGKRLFFVSNRPTAGMPQDKPSKTYHLWYVDHLRGDEWGTPYHIDGPVNPDSCSDYGPSVSARGTLFWCSRDREGNKGMQGYYARWQGDHYDRPKMIRIDGMESVQDPFVAPDESFLVFLNGMDLYVSMRRGDGWGPAEKLGVQVNNGDYNSSPYVSRDGKTLYYSSGRVKGFYQREYNSHPHPLSYGELEKEMDGCFNGSGNVLMISVNLPHNDHATGGAGSIGGR